MADDVHWSVWLASTGLLEGKTCTTNEEFLDMAKQLYPGTNWLRQRWVVEEKEYDGADGRKGELWTAGGAGTGKMLLLTHASRCLLLQAGNFADMRTRY